MESIMKLFWENFLKLIVITLLMCMPLFMSNCGGGVLPLQIEGVEEAGEEEEIEEEVMALPVTSFKLVRLDGTELGPDEIPIPRSVKIKLTFDRALDQGEREVVQNGFVLREGETSLGVSFQWTDDQTVIIIPDRWFGYGKTYSVGLSNEVATWAAQVSKATEFLELIFTTASWGDVDGDGVVDIIVGEVGADAGGISNTGRVHIFEVGSGMGDCDLSQGCFPDASISISAEGVNLGLSVSMAGDVNADGYADFMMSAPGIAAGVNPGKRGWVYIFYGSKGGIADCNLSLAPPDLGACALGATITGAGEYDLLGNSVSDAGDVNGDGYDDIIIGAPHNHYGAEADVGQVYVFLGSASGIGDCDLSLPPSDPNACTPDATITGMEAGSKLGMSVSSAGDVNGDGYDDVVMGAYEVESETGHAYVFHGSGVGISDCNMFEDCDPHALIIGENMGDELGTSVSGVGDVNGDGYDDVIVGAPFYDVVHDEGRAYVFLGSENGILGGLPECQIFGDPTCPVAAMITGETEGAGMGFVSAAGDVDGDGYDDVIVGAPFHHVTAAMLEGRAYVLYGSAGGIAAEPRTIINGAERQDFLGISSTGAGDLNGDGFDDILVGAMSAGDFDNGRVYVFYGSGAGISNCDVPPLGDCEPAITITGADNSNLCAVR